MFAYEWGARVLGPGPSSKMYRVTALPHPTLVHDLIVPVIGHSSYDLILLVIVIVIGRTTKNWSYS